MATIDVSLPELMRRWIERRVESGLYVDAGDYLRDLIRHDQSCVGYHSSAVRLEALIAEGIADTEAGRIFDAEDVFEDMEAAIREIELRKKA